MSTYSKDEIIKKLEVAKSEMGQFYSQDFVNYRGKTSDKERDYYTEIIAEWLLDNIELFNDIKMISRENSYKVDSHDGKIKNEKSEREEEIIAMKLFHFSQNQGKVFDIIGKIIDYQTPLKNIRADKAGKIDLLAYNEEEKTLRILELKKPDSEETMLRCVLEAYTYLKVVDKDKLLKDFGLPENTKIKACPFVFYGKEQHKEMKEMKEIKDSRKNLEKLIEELGIEVIYLKEKDGEYIVKKWLLLRWKITKINYIRVLEYLEKYYGLPYKNPDAKGLTNEEKNKFSSIKKVSQETINEMKRIVEQCEELYSLHNFLTIKWLDGTNTRIKKYLWLQMKYEKYKELPISISLSVEKNFSKVKYYVSFEIKDSKSSSHLLEKYHLHLDIPKRENMLYTTGNNELEDFIILKENNLELKKKIQTRELEKVKLCVCIEGNQDSTNDYYDKKIKEAIKELIPYYEYVINKI